jgi:hypothetical protein
VIDFYQSGMVGAPVVLAASDVACSADRQRNQESSKAAMHLVCFAPRIAAAAALTALLLMSS